jgi:2-methylcitrate dehydratase PrpD
VKVTTRSGKTVEKLVLHRRGSPEDPLKPADIEYKFRHILRSCIPEERMTRILALVRDLEKLETTRELTDLTAQSTNER